MNIKKYGLLFVLFMAVLQSEIIAAGDTVTIAKSLKLKIGGFFRSDFVYDTRKTGEVVDGLVSFYPLPKMPDANGADINEMSSISMSAIATRLTTTFFGPDIFNAKSSAYIEFDFTGMSNTYGIRLRQTYGLLDWGGSNLLIGRTWHPLSAACIPNVIGFNTGAPFWMFNRSDQIKYTWLPGKFSLSATAAMQGDYSSLGPDAAYASGAYKSNMYMRNSSLPEFNLMFKYGSGNIEMGIGGHTKTIQPRTYTKGAGEDIYKTNEKLTTWTAMGFFKYANSMFQVKASSIYAQNMTESLMLGGYAVSDKDPVTGAETYTPIKHLNSWINLDYGKKWQTGLFAGYVRNLGAADKEISDIYARAADIRSMYRISPHLFYNIKNAQFGSELEISSAEYGTIDRNDYGKVKDTDLVTNVRLNLIMVFFF